MKDDDSGIGAGRREALRHCRGGRTCAGEACGSGQPTELDQLDDVKLLGVQERQRHAGDRRLDQIHRRSDRRKSSGVAHWVGRELNHPVEHGLPSRQVRLVRQPLQENVPTLDLVHALRPEAAMRLREKLRRVVSDVGRLGRYPAFELGDSFIYAG